jgi:hypothetical protein
MTICPRCRSERERETEWCPDCRVALLRLVETDAGPVVIDFNDDDDWGEDIEPAGRPVEPSSLKLLLEEPLPEMADMIREFLQNSGISCVVHANSLGYLYRLNAPLCRSRVYVHADDYDTARELVGQFFGSN